MSSRLKVYPNADQKWYWDQLVVMPNGVWGWSGEVSEDGAAIYDKLDPLTLLPHAIEEIRKQRADANFFAAQLDIEMSRAKRLQATVDRMNALLDEAEDYLPKKARNALQVARQIPTLETIETEGNA